ncbi:dTDP-4-amino-4,6-dideoxygalactose transaminase [Marinitoga sp. 1138]|uniref:dTDP-4-amino-4,6-dideoxygalactose transaminase n=1 Tax=Marinitoga sp. 1138 TaxID=1643334 RepID=UPI001586795D|nr:dTDP-4-amino-4,6-dideoxygalactose transaminase [Marinitoga sp. 1138]NUU97595.1 TDP-4-oxo-6-deoxy-D-glucose aminotransferase [Marinitoga sp. 1138]
MINFNKVYYDQKEFKYIKDCIASSKISGDGKYTHKVQEFLERKFKAKKILLTTSASTALDMASILINIKPGDEVILPSYTFVSTANSILLRGAKPIFVDIDKKTLNIDINKIEEKINSKTRALIPVHYAGISSDMDKILYLAKKYNLYIIEDAAQAVNAKYKNSFLGTIGNIGVYSFHETKNYTCGEGGAIILNDESFIERAEIIREKGTNRSKFFRGEIDKYTWVDIGSSFLISDILSAFLLAQIEKMDYILEKRKCIYEKYYEGLKDLEERNIITLPIIPEYNKSNYHMFFILLKNEEIRDNLMYKLKEKGIQALFHYIPLHISPMGKKLGYKEGDLPITEDVSKRILRLPFHLHLTDKEIEYIIKSIYDILMK